MPLERGLVTDTYRARAEGALPTSGGEASVLWLFGSVDLATHAAFEAGLNCVSRDDPDRIIVDASAMTFCGARGLGALMGAVAAGAERGTDVALVGFSTTLHRLCAQLWPGPQPTPYPSVAQAVAEVVLRRDERRTTTVAASPPRTRHHLPAPRRGVEVLGPAEVGSTRRRPPGT